MSINIKSLKLDKQRYIFGIDKNIELLVEIETDKNETIDKIIIQFGYDFYGKNNKHKAFEDSIIEEKITLSSGIINKLFFHIPIKFFNIVHNDAFSDMKIENYINFKIKTGLFTKNEEKIIPNIVFEQEMYGLKNFKIEYNNSNNGEADLSKIEKFIKKNDYNGYLNIIKEITEISNNINSLYDSETGEIINGMEEKYYKLYENKRSIEEKKIQYFIIKKEKVLEHKDLLARLKTVIDKSNNNSESKSDDYFIEIQKINKVINEISSIKKDLYKCYESENEIEYNNILNNYYNNLSLPETDVFQKRIKIHNDIKNNVGDYITIKKSFNGILSGNFSNILETSIIGADYLHKDIYNELKKNIFINCFNKLVNSKIYNFIYKYIFILPLIFYIGNDYVYNILKVYINSQFIPLIFLVFPIGLIIISKIMEIIYSKILLSLIYNYKLHSNKEIEYNLKSKLLNGTLKITDIFKFLDIKIDDSNIEYNFLVSLSLKVGTYSGSGKSTAYHICTAYNLDLFNYNGKGHFNLNDAKLLDNNYSGLENIVPNSVNNSGTKVYYELSYIFDSSYIPDITGTLQLFINFNDN